jgi:Flagellar assembly protein T, C-terminal domain
VSTERTEAMVASVLSRRDVAFNAGSNQGVQEGDIATVVKEAEIKDPETAESLGVVRRASVRLRIYEVQPKFSVGRTYESAQAQTQGSLGITLSWIGQETMQVTTSDANQDYRTVLVRPGDEVFIEHAPQEEEAAETQEEAS